MTSAYYVPPDRIDGTVVSFPEAELRHLTRVLRLAPPAVVEVIDGAGGRYQVELTVGVAGRVEGRVLEKLLVQQERPLVGVALAVCRPERMKLAAEKLAELSCHRLVLIRTGYVDYAGNLEALREKLSRVAVSALKQSRSPWLMRIDTGVDLAELIARAGKDCCPVFCQRAAENELAAPGSIRLPQAAEYLLVVGPEGGFTAQEAELIRNSRLPRLHLGEHWLRAETAAVAGLVLLRQIVSGGLGLY